MDSLKWLMYALNFSGKALFTNSNDHKKIKIDPVECDVELIKHVSYEGDSSIYLFVFRKDKLRFLYIDDHIFREGFLILGNIKYPITRHATFDYENSIDSLKEYIVNSEMAFEYYLKSYNGRISPWLQHRTR